MIPGLIGLVMAVIGTLITSIGMVREREAGTLEQLAVMPIKAPLNYCRQNFALLYAGDCRYERGGAGRGVPV